jgi:hypothetical protein
MQAPASQWVWVDTNQMRFIILIRCSFPLGGGSEERQFRRRFGDTLSAGGAGGLTNWTHRVILQLAPVHPGSSASSVRVG